MNRNKTEIWIIYNLDIYILDIYILDIENRNKTINERIETIEMIALSSQI